MTNENPTQLSTNKQALLKIRQLQARIAELQTQSVSHSEPIAIVSMACRFPRRSQTPEAFWQSLVDGTDEVSEVPDDRWDLDAFYDADADVPGRMYARHGAFLDHLDLMDPEFFGISPREATWVDPQQRLLMEVGWEAIERAGWLPSRIGPDTGIFIGWMHNDYQNESSDSFLNLNPYIATGAAGSFLCGRLAYYLGLQGPSVAIDTACSSSLVALHLACQSLQQRECDYVLAGGVNAICSPTTNILTCKLKALSPNGHSRAFDASADGYLRGEGCGVVTLRRLADAERDGDTILGVIRGSAIGHNGFSSGLTAPNPKAQEKVIRQALERAQLEPSDVAYLEAHGTGTELGDPLEMQAAIAALAAERDPNHPLLVGSVKTNIGHLEAAAGMAGLIKVLLALKHDQLPGQLHFETPNPHIPWQESAVKVLTQLTNWPDQNRKIAGVSAFGMSGTNAHVIVEAAPQDAAMASVDDEQADVPELLVVSGKSEEALQCLASDYEKLLSQGSGPSLADLAWTSATCREHFDHRAAVIAQTPDEARDGLRLVAKRGRSPSVFIGNSRRAPMVAWQFTGQGSQYVGMGRRLYETEPLFRKTIDYCDEFVRSRRDSSLTDVMFADAEQLKHTSWAQPAIFALQWGLTRVLQQRGLAPDIVWGHSVGQYAAACVAGVMSWEDGLHLIAERGRLLGELPAGGRMLAIFAPLADVEDTISRSDSTVAISVAANNGSHIVVSGEESAVTRVEQSFVERGIRCAALSTSHAFHSALMEPALEPFCKVADEVQFAPAQIPLICNVTGHVMELTETVDGAYWARHIRQPVRFSESIATAVERGCAAVLEVGPQSILTQMAAANWNQPADRLVSCLQKGVDDAVSMQRALGQLHVHGAKLNFEALYAGRTCRKVPLPTYPFQRRRFWGPDKPRAMHAEFHTAHPLLGNTVSLAGTTNEIRYEGFIEPNSPPWLPDHEVMGEVVLPGAAFIDLALAAAGDRVLEDVTFELPLRPSGRTALQTVVRAADDDSSVIETYSAAVGETQWQRHFKASLTTPAGDRPSAIDLTELQNQTGPPVDPAQFYQKMQDVGLRYGPDFQTISSLQVSNDGVLTQLKTNGDVRGFIIPPTLLDGALHSLASGLLREDNGDLFLPVGIRSVRCYQPVGQEIWCYARWNDTSGSTRSADVTLLAESGEVVAELEGLTVQQMSRAVLRQMSGAGAERLLYETRWQPSPLTAAAVSDKKWLVVRSDDGQTISSQLVTSLSERGHTVLELTLQAGASVTQESPTAYRLDAVAGDQWELLFSELAEPDAPYQPDGIVWVCSASDSSADAEQALPRSTQQQCDGLLNLIHTLHAQGLRQLECGLMLITTHAVALEGESKCTPDQAQYWGFGRVLGAEEPDLRCRLVDITEHGIEEGTAARAITELLVTETRDSQLVVRQSDVLAARIRQVAGSADASKFQINSAASYLITGGLGMLGRQAAKWLADHGATQVVLVSRRTPDDETQQFLDEIQQSGCQVVVQSADLASRRDTARLFEQFGNGLQPLAGIIHAAGVLDDGLVDTQNWERFERVLSPKVIGARLLDEFSHNHTLDFFIMYSSAASVLGSPGQSNYATANAWLDGLAWHRRTQGLPALSINWGPWSAGMADDERIVKRLALQGVTPLGVAESHRAMEQLLSAGATQATVIDVDWRRMLMGLGGDSPSILEGLAPERRGAQVADSAFVGQLKRLRDGARRDLLVSTIQELLQSVLSTPDAPETDRPLIEMGLDSLMAVEFSTQLQMMLGESYVIGPTMLFDHPTIEAICGYVLSMMTDEAEEEPTATAVPARGSDSPEVRVREPIAVIGMSCRFPGARDVDEFWDNLLAGVDSVTEIPDDRWDVDRFFDADREPGKMYTREGGFLDDIAGFDAAFFNISDQEACWIDPQHRLLLENSYRAMEDAGISVSPLTDRNVGVFMGIMGQDYAFLPQLDDQNIISAFQGAGLSHSAGVGRISYVFGFEGPSIAVDTASSSSLVAVYQAMRSLQDGNCNMALAGGANAILAPVNSLLMSQAGLLAPDGRCKSFSATADGFGRGEGCGVVVMKRLSDAQRDGDRIMAVLRGGAVVHNGFSGGITTPSGKAQGRVIGEALQDAELAPSEIQYLEAHGTGTELGDPMEISAAASVYGRGRNADNPLLVGSVKANISHLEAAGGISGLIKTVLSLDRGVIPPQIHFETPSPHIPWKRLPVRVPVEPTPWPEADVKAAGVTALGLAGTNAHVVLSSPPADAMSADTAEVSDPAIIPERPAHLLVLSARDQTALTTLTRRYREFLVGSQPSGFAEICHTAAIGRRHDEYRVALVAESIEDAADQLSALSRSDNRHGSGTERSGSSPKVAWVFTGDPSSSLRAARSLYRADPGFREIIGAFDEQIKNGCEKSKQPDRLPGTWLADDSPTEKEDAESGCEVCLFAVQAGLAQLWRSWGIEPDAVVGFGVGQYAAAAVAGGVSFDDALMLVVERQQALRAIPDHQESALDEFESFADQFNYYPPNLPLVCSVSGDVVPVHRSLGGSHWRQHLTSAPSERSLQTLIDLDCDFIMELGPTASLDQKGQTEWLNQPTTVLSSFAPKRTATESMLGSLGRLYVGGVTPDFASFDRHWKRKRVRLPAYPFRKQRYWITELDTYMEQTPQPTANSTTS